MKTISNPTSNGTVAGALTGLALWALATYAFKGAVPNAVQAVIYVVIPAAVTGVTGYLTKKGVLTAAAKASKRS
jgi:hypothetical protein